MVLKFHGGVNVDAKKLFAESEIKNIDSCSAICIPAREDAEVAIPEGSDVLRGTLLGISDGTPVYSSIAGRFNGILEIDGNNYFVVMNNGEMGEERIFRPEHREVKELTREDIINGARKFGIIDPRSGEPLWKLLYRAKDCRRVVVDCTEPFPSSAIVQRICIEHARDLVFGAKILVHCLSALKCVFAAEESKKEIFDILGEFAWDDRLFAAAPMEEKYPIGDIGLMYGLYVKVIKNGESPSDHGIFIISAEAVLALYEAMRDGMPQTQRFITICGEGMEKGGNFRVPRGITFHDLSNLCGGFPEGKLLIENTLLSGKLLSGALSDSTIAIITADEAEKQEMPCISCGECARACPVRLFPAEVLMGNKKHLEKICISCGACQYICPGGIPLMQMIKENEETEEQEEALAPENREITEIAEEEAEEHDSGN